VQAETGGAVPEGAADLAGQLGAGVASESVLFARVKLTMSAGPGGEAPGDRPGQHRSERSLLSRGRHHGS